MAPANQKVLTIMLQIRTDELRYAEEAIKVAGGEIAKVRAVWDQPSWDELDWSRVRELRTLEIFEHRKQEATKVQTARALDCPNFVKHVRHDVCSAAMCMLIRYSSPCFMTSGSLKNTYLN